MLPDHTIKTTKAIQKQMTKRLMPETTMQNHNVILISREPIPEEAASSWGILHKNLPSICCTRSPNLSSKGSKEIYQGLLLYFETCQIQNLTNNILGDPNVIQTPSRVQAYGGTVMHGILAFSHLTVDPVIHRALSSGPKSISQSTNV